MKNKKTIKLSKSCIGDDEINAVANVLKNEYLGMGEQVKEFENKLSAFFGRPAVCVVNGTAAIHLSVQALGISEGDEILIQSLTYVASVQAISATNATPIFCDIEPRTLTIDLRDAERRLTKRTKAIMPVHYAGGVGKLKDIYLFAQKHNLRVIEDAAHAFGTIYNNKLVGSFGDIACFSFDGIKNITSGEGGCIVTKNEDLISKIKDLRLLGVEKDTENRFSGKRSWEFDVKNQGWRYHMSNLMAAIGTEQLKRIDEFSNKRRYLSKLYYRLLRNLEHIDLPVVDYENVLMHIFPVLLEETLNRENIRSELLKKGIQTGVHYFPNHLLSFYQSKTIRNLKNTELIYPRLITLPLHPDLSEDDIRYVVECLTNLI